MAIVESDMCGVHTIQFMTGCTLGKGNLVQRDFGKNACTFMRRSDSRAIRLGPKRKSAARDPEWYGLFANVRAGTAN